MRVKIDDQVSLFEFEMNLESGIRRQYLANEKEIVRLQSQNLSKITNNCLIILLEANLRILEGINLIEENEESQIQFLSKKHFYSLSLYKALISIENPTENELYDFYKYKMMAREYDLKSVEQVDQERRDYEHALSLEAAEMMELELFSLKGNNYSNQSLAQDQRFFNGNRKRLIDVSELSEEYANDFSNS